MAVTLEDLAQQLLDCLCAALGAAGWSGSCCLEVGPAIFDDCCTDKETGEPGGKAWVRLIDIYPSTRYPNPAQPSDLVNEETELAARFEVGAATCMCFELCDCETRSANTSRALRIAEALLAALACCESDISGCLTDVRFAGLSQVGSPEEGCAGYAATVTVPYKLCCPTE